MCRVDSFPPLISDNKSVCARTCVSPLLKYVLRLRKMIHGNTHTHIEKDPAGSTQQKLISSTTKRNETSVFQMEREAAVIHQVLSGIKRPRGTEREREIVIKRRAAACFSSLVHSLRAFAAALHQFRRSANPPSIWRTPSLSLRRQFPLHTCSF